MVNSGEKNRIKSSGIDRVFDILVYCIAIFAFLIVLIPLMNVISSSFSSGKMVQTGQVRIFPKEFTLDAYKMVFGYRDIWIGYRNTIFYTFVGTTLNVIFTILMAYPLSRRDLKGKGIIMKLLVFTMMFSGGLIPNYLLVKNLHLLNTAWSLWLPGLLSVYNVIVMRTFFQTTIPEELLEAAQIDGCGYWGTLFRVIIPMSKPGFVTIGVFAFMSYWNEYILALTVLKPDHYTLPVGLKNLMEVQKFATDWGAMFAGLVIVMMPTMVFYALVQKKLTSGLSLGGLKG